MILSALFVCTIFWWPKLVQKINFAFTVHILRNFSAQYMYFCFVWFSMVRNRSPNFPFVVYVVVVLLFVNIHPQRTYWKTNRSHLNRLMTKPTKWPVRPAKIQISLDICPGWSEASLSWKKPGSLATNWAYSKYSDQTGRIPRLIWVFAGRTGHFVGFVMLQLI